MLYICRSYHTDGKLLNHQQIGHSQSFSIQMTQEELQAYFSFSSDSAFLSQGLFSAIETAFCSIFFLYDLLNWLGSISIKLCNFLNVFYSMPIVIVYKYISFSKVTNVPQLLCHFHHIKIISPLIFLIFYQKLVHLVCMETTVSVNSLRWNETGYKIKGNKAR